MHTQDGVSLTPSSGGLNIAAQLRGKECQWNGIIFLLLGHSPKVPALEGSALENCQLLQAVLLGGSVCHGLCSPSSVLHGNAKVSISIHWGLWAYGSLKLSRKCCDSCSFCAATVQSELSSVAYLEACFSRVLDG